MVLFTKEVLIAGYADTLRSVLEGISQNKFKFIDAKSNSI